MLPLYKVFSLFVRVFSRPLINYTKKIHANNPSKSFRLRKFFIWFGNFYHRFEAKINRKFLKIQSEFAFKPLNDELAMQKGIEFFYELVFYCIVIGLPLYEMNRQADENKAKSERVHQRLQNIQKKMELILNEVQVVGRREKIHEFFRQNQGKYCYPNLKIMLETGIPIGLYKHQQPIIEYKMCLL